MFCAFNWFLRPQMLGTVRARLIDWLKSPGRIAYLNMSGATITDPKLEKRSFNDEEITLIEFLIADTRNGIGFGGYTSNQNLNDINGWCHFRLEPAKNRAGLIALVTNDNLADAPPLQSPVLHLALIELLIEYPELERLYLPFEPTSQEDRECMRMNDLKPLDEVGWWVIDHEKDEEDSIEFLPSNADLNWLEISMPTEPALIPYITQIFVRFAGLSHLILDWRIRKDQDGEMGIDELAPAKIRTYLPVDENAQLIFDTIYAKLANLSLVHALNQLGVSQKTPLEWANLWKSDRVCQLGSHIVVRVGEQKYDPQPDDILIDITPTYLVFGPTRSGLHPTTIMCLELLEQYINPTIHHNLIDVGTGTGILAILASRLGVPNVLALDVQKESLVSARENIARNDLTAKIMVDAGSLAVMKVIGPQVVYAFADEVQNPPAALASLIPADIIICNTFSNVIIGLADAFAGALRPEGLLFTSGIVATKAGEVNEALEAVGFRMVESRESDNWVALTHKYIGNP